MSAAVGERLSRFFAAEPTRQGILARAELGRPGEGDGELAGRLRSALAGALRPDGSVGGAALPTIWLMHELLDLGEPPGSPVLGPPLAWLLQGQGRPGAFGHGCDRERHRRRVCEHFVTGFFAPAPPEQRLAPVTLPNGKAYRAEPAARFAISCLALRAVLRAGAGAEPAVRRHVQSLARLAEHWTTRAASVAPDTTVAALHALALSGPEQGEPAARIVGVVRQGQTPDGSWPGADLFQLLEALCAVEAPEALNAVRRAMPALAARQRSDGSFGTTARQERALIGLRAALRADGGS